MFILSYPSSDSIFLKDEISFVNAFRSRLELTEFKSVYPIDSETRRSRKRGLQRKKFYFFFFLDRLFFTIESPARLYLTSVTGHPVCRGNAASFPFAWLAAHGRSQLLSRETGSRTLARSFSKGGSF